MTLLLNSSESFYLAIRHELLLPRDWTQLFAEFLIQNSIPILESGFLLGKQFFGRVEDFDRLDFISLDDLFGDRPTPLSLVRK